MSGWGLLAGYTNPKEGKVKIAQDGQEFLGACKGVRLVKRGPDDPHICLLILTEDDDNWFPSKEPFSSFWLDDLLVQLNANQLSSSSVRISRQI